MVLSLLRKHDKSDWFKCCYEQRFGRVGNTEASSVAWPMTDRQFETISAGNSGC